jgi:hypothetical protein
LNHPEGLLLRQIVTYFVYHCSNPVNITAKYLPKAIPSKFADYLLNKKSIRGHLARHPGYPAGIHINFLAKGASNLKKSEPEHRSLRKIFSEVVLKKGPRYVRPFINNSTKALFERRSIQFPHYKSKK